MTLFLILLASVTVAVADEDKVTERCALCHEEETKQWAASPHALSLSPAFTAVWEREGKKWECLVCHTSRYDRKTGGFSHEGVSCESCHGPVGEDHPDKQSKALPVSSQTCETCHGITFGEWRISAHGQKNIRCFDCHKMHSMQMRKDDPDQMCGTCHTARLESFSHATHSLQGLHCITCHMPDLSLGVPKIKGTGVRGHTFGVGAETCAKCHAEMVHTSATNAELQKEVRQLKSVAPEALSREVVELKKQTGQLHDALTANRRVFGPVVGVAFALGLVIGFAVPHINRKGREAGK